MSGIMVILQALPWRRILPVVGVVVVVGLIAWRVDSYFDHVAKVERQVVDQAKVIDRQVKKMQKMTAEQRKANAEIEGVEAALAEAEALYGSLKARPPAEVVRWRESVVRVPQEVTGPTCEDALVQASEVLAGAAGWPGGG